MADSTIQTTTLSPDGEVFRRKLIKKKAVTIVQPASSFMDARFAKAPTESTANEEPQA